MRNDTSVWDIMWKLKTIKFYIKHPIGFITALRHPLYNFKWYFKRNITNG